MSGGICVCVCTHDRPEGLSRLLRALVPQLLSAKASLVVVDNGTVASEPLVGALPNNVACTYARLAEPGLVAARNHALAQAIQTSPEFIAFIDDDEVPDAPWLDRLLTSLTSTGADICFGPLRPEYSVQPPVWAQQGPFFWKTGKTYGTGNVMLRAAVIPLDPSQWFQPAFAFLGGEDEEFFARLAVGGARVVTAAEAWVSEQVPAQRLTLQYITRTGARDGAIEVALMRQRGLSAIARVVAGLGHIVRKAAYMLYHMALLWKGSWHGVAALRDAAEIGGTLRALAGRSGTYYGKPKLTR